MFSNTFGEMSLDSKLHFLKYSGISFTSSTRNIEIIYKVVATLITIQLFKDILNTWY